MVGCGGSTVYGPCPPKHKTVNPQNGINGSIILFVFLWNVMLAARCCFCSLWMHCEIWDLSCILRVQKTEWISSFLSLPRLYLLVLLETNIEHKKRCGIRIIFYWYININTMLWGLYIVCCKLKYCNKNVGKGKTVLMWSLCWI